MTPNRPNLTKISQPPTPPPPQEPENVWPHKPSASEQRERAGYLLKHNVPTLGKKAIQIKPEDLSGSPDEPVPDLISPTDYLDQMPQQPHKKAIDLKPEEMSGAFNEPVPDVVSAKESTITANQLMVEHTNRVTTLMEIIKTAKPERLLDIMDRCEKMVQTGQAVKEFPSLKDYYRNVQAHAYILLNQKGLNWQNKGLEWFNNLDQGSGKELLSFTKQFKKETTH